MTDQTARRGSGRKRVLVRVGIVVSALAGWLWSGTSLALVITFIQITNSGGCSHSPSINKDGSQVAFLSDGNLTGNNADGNSEIFVWKRATGSFVQVTNSTGCCNDIPAISAKNNRIAFVSDLDLIAGSNTDGSNELFLWDPKSGLKQLTTDSSGNCCIDRVRITGDGKRIAFASSQDLTGNNAAGTEEIFLWDDKTGLTQLTHSTGAYSYSPDISSDAIRVAFVSSADLVGNNADGNEEIFLWEDGNGFTQITNTTGGSNSLPVINAEGKRIAFVSSADLVGSNADGNTQLFLWDNKAGVIQVTNAKSEDTVTDPAINAYGNRVAFASNADLVGSNPDGNFEIFLWDRDTGISQITNTANGAEETIDNGEPTIDKKGDVIAFTVERNDFSAETTDQEILVADIKE